MVVKKKFLQESLQGARDAAANVKEIHLKAEVLAVIASVSDSMDDFRAALQTTSNISAGDFRSSALAAIAKKLAKLRKFRQARDVVHSIRAVDNYWRAQAIAWIALYSRQPADFGKSREFARKVDDPRLLEVINLYENYPEKGHEQLNESLVEGQIVTLVSDLTKINQFDEAHHIATSESNAYLRAHAFAVMASILAEAIGR